jgi:hypothetical protein
LTLGRYLRNAGKVGWVGGRVFVMLIKALIKKKTLFRWYRPVHVQVCKELQDVFMFPKRVCGEHCMQRACIHAMCSECNISDLAILLRGWNFASGSVAVTGCTVASCLLMKGNFSMTASIIHTTLMCGQL